MSLRARLVTGLLALTALGLVVAGVITYAEQRSFLLDRVDQQARAALPAVSHALDQRGVSVPGFGGVQGPFGTAPGGDQADLVNLPPGTYGQRRDGTGRVLGNIVLSYGEGLPAGPDIPDDLPLNEVVTIGSVKGSDLHYRALAVRSFNQPGTTVIAVPLREVDRTLDRLLRVEALVIAGVLIALAILSWLLVRIGLRPLDRIARTAGAIAAGDLSRRVGPADSRTEVGRLGIALNAMLERLEQAFDEREASENRLRRFLADASHELRTPLASIRGYAELFRIGAARDGRDVEKSMRRIEEEAARMGVVVEDLLTLARLDEVHDVVREEVDLAGIAADAVADARATDLHRTIALHAEQSVVVSGDPHQLRQVLANLLRNALVHTPPGTAIDVSVEARGERAVLKVRDHGPGLPTTDTETLFERFSRMGKGRERGRAGAGLGLAIVAGIVAAHGGRVAAENAPDGGARFTVELPVRAVRAERPAATSAV
jgi:two-component system OmpR family sensor kinase